MLDLPPPFDAVWFRFVAGFIIGACLGSFGTMLAYRLPRRLSIVSPPSRCPACGTNLKFLDLIPLLSWLFLHGKCRHCHANIGAKYLWIELGISFTGGLIGILIGLQ